MRCKKDCAITHTMSFQYSTSVFDTRGTTPILYESPVPWWLQRDKITLENEMCAQNDLVIRKDIVGYNPDGYVGFWTILPHRKGYADMTNRRCSLQLANPMRRVVTRCNLYRKCNRRAVVKDITLMSVHCRVEPSEACSQSSPEKKDSHVRHALVDCNVLLVASRMSQRV